MEISAIEFLQRFKNQDFALIDVRSEGEFLKGKLPGAINIPILANEHRHLVGICYKEKGPSEAIHLGHSLVDPSRENLILRWMEASDQREPLVHCWRGGLRSLTASQWMREAGLKPSTIIGGYKAVRGLLLDILENSYEFYVLAGLTGSGKTELLRRLPIEFFIDLESIAQHRGSAFGAFPNTNVTQQNFENALALQLYHCQGRFLLEDESRSIGQMKIPLNIFLQMQEKPYIVLERPLEDRVNSIYQEYIFNSKWSSIELAEKMLGNLARIQKRLGGLRYKEILEKMTDAFNSSSMELHLEWISMLLKYYYDPLYQQRLEEIKDREIFRGNPKEVHEFISDCFGRSRTR